MRDDPGREALAPTDGSRFVGRGDELRRVRRALARPPALVLVEGEAGIGKTRLVREVLSGPRAGSAMVAVCPPFREALTLGPLVDAARSYGRPVAGAGLSALAGTLRPLFPEWVADLPPAPEPLADSGAARHRLLRALAELLDRFGVRTLVVEDLHWADDATLDFLLFLVAMRPQPLSLLLTYRPEDLPGESPLLRLSSRISPGVSHERVELRGIGVPDTADLVRSMLGADKVSDAFANFLHERTEGVPLAVEETVRLLRDRADVLRREGEWLRRTLDDIAVPPTIRDAVTERVARLGPDAQAVLLAAAVMARTGDTAEPGTVAALSAGRARVAVDDAARSGLLVLDGETNVAFRHVLVAKAVYDHASAPDRREAHRRAAEALEKTRPDAVPALAHHWRAAGDLVKWRDYAVRAAVRARDSGDHATAVAVLHELITSDGLPSAMLAPLVRKLPLLAITGDTRRGEVIETLRTVLASDQLERPDRGELRAQLGRMLIHASQYEVAMLEYEQAVPDLEHRPSAAVRAMITLGVPIGTARHASEHLRWLQRAAVVAGSADIPEEDRPEILLDRATALLELGEESGWEAASGVGSDESTPRAALVLARAALNFGNSAMRWGRLDDARRRLAQCVEVSDRHDYERLRDLAVVTLVHLDLLAGRWNGLAARAQPWIGLADEPMIDADIRLILATLDIAAGRGAEVAETLGQISAEFARRGIPEMAYEAASRLGGVRLSEGDVDGALAAVWAHAEGVVSQQVWPWCTELVPVAVAAQVAAGRREDARQLVDSFDHGLRDRDIAAPQAALAQCRAVLLEAEQRYAEAAGVWKRTADAWARLPRPYEALKALERVGNCMLEAAEREAGIAALKAAAGMAGQLGAVGDLDRIDAALRRHGESPARVWRGGRRGYGDQLSPRELEVVKLMMTGMTNKQIAEVLSRSPKTVAAQLNSAMRKHSVSSRTALAVSVAQAGIASPPAE